MAGCFILQWSGWNHSLQFDRSLIADGQWYRLVTANFVHLNTMHLVMNLLGLGLVMMFFASHLKWFNWLLLIVLSSFAVTGGIYWLNPEIWRYVGLSGVLHALFISGAVIEIKRFPISGWLLLAVLILKLGWEQINGAMPGSESMINGRVVVDSHLYGAVAGLVFILIKNGSIKKLFRALGR